MQTNFISELNSLLAESDAKVRKHWAEKIVREQIPLHSLMSLLHGDTKTAQRFTWLIGDLLEIGPNVVIECLPMLFSLRDQMPFPGMRRCVAKCLWFTNVPAEFEDESIDQLFEWLANDRFSISCKHYSAKALFELSKQKRIPASKLDRILRQQVKHSNPAHASRMKKLRQRLESLR